MRKHYKDATERTPKLVFASVRDALLTLASKIARHNTSLARPILIVIILRAWSFMTFGQRRRHQRSTNYGNHANRSERQNMRAERYTSRSFPLLVEEAPRGLRLLFVAKVSRI